MSTHCIADLYPFNRPQTLPENVLCLKAKSQKNVDKTICHWRKLGETLNIDSDKLWFRGLSTVHFYDLFYTGHQRRRQRQYVWSRNLCREEFSNCGELRSCERCCDDFQRTLTSEALTSGNLTYLIGAL